MSKYNIIKTATDAYIKANGRREITGPVLNAILNAIIESLGKYYQMVGVALPADDPGTPDQNVAFLAGTPGTYTKFGNSVVAAGEIALLKYDGEWSKAVLYSVPTEVSDLTNDLGFVTNSVNDLLNYYLKTETYTKGQVDSLIAAVKQFRYIVTDTLPTASADTMNIIYLVPSDDPMTGDVKDEYITIEVGGVYSWEKIGRTDIDLSNYPTNAQMAQAIDDALAAYITGINATIDNNHGTPSVNVQYASGILTLAFHNLKGDTGERGPVGVESVNVAVDNNTGIPTATATMSGGVLTLNFYNLKGAQGNSGYQGAAGELLVVNNLTDGGATAALSAEMGKVLQGEISQLEAELHNLSGKYYGVFASVNDLPEGDAVGYAFVGSENPYAIWNFDGTEWSDSGSVANGITGEPGVGFSSIFTPSPYDGTVIIVLSNNDTITLDLNHSHPAYPRYTQLADEAAYQALTTKESDMLYLIPESSS